MNGKKWAGFLSALAGIAATIVVAKQPHSHPAPPPSVPSVPTYTLVAHVCNGGCDLDRKIPGAAVTVNHAALGIVTDGAGNAAFGNITAGAYTVCAKADGYGETCTDHRVPADGEVFLALTPTFVELPRLGTNGNLFTANGQPWRWKGVSSFALLNRFAHGEDISDVLAAYQGFNVLRVWPYVPAKDWGAQAWDSPSPDVVVAFLQRCAQAGFYVELTLLTDDDPARIPQARALLAALAAAHPSNLVLEIGNEPIVHKNINTVALKADALASGFLVSSGNYEDTRLWYGQWLGFHSGRDGEWPRRAHDAIDYWNGGGPDFPEEPAIKAPSVCDEPIRPDEADYNAPDFRAYFASCALMAGGATYHTQTGKFGLPPTPEEARIAVAVLDALNAFPADAPNAPYRRIDEGGRSLRTYAIGNYMVRVRPTTKDAPEAGWTAIDADGVLWRK